MLTNICIYISIGAFIALAIDLISLTTDKESELLKLGFGNIALLFGIEALAWPVIIYKMCENAVVLHHMRKQDWAR